MKKLLLLLTAALVALSLTAAPVDPATAQKKAKSFLAEYYAGKLMAPAALNPVLLKAEIGNSKLNQPVYYIYNTSETFLVLAGDDRAEEILMVGDEPLKDINNLSPGMKGLLSQYKEEIMFLQEHPDVQVEKPSQTAVPQLRAVTYGPLLTAKWDQTAPYWSQCVFTYNNRSYQCLTGCPATSASMVLYYWKYPTTQVPAVASYSSTLELSYYQSVNFTYPSVSATTFDWANMKDTYTSYNSTQSNAVATLMRYVGQLEKMMYGTESAGGSGIYTTDSERIATMFKTLGYDSNTRLANKSSYSAANWAALIQGEMAAGRPVVYLGVDPQGGGHAFNVDGYRDSDNKYHVNFGWSGDGNSWYAMNAFTYGGYTFSSSQQAIVGIQPPGGAVNTPQLTVNPTSLSFTGCSTGETYTKTFTVTGTNLTGNVTLSSSNSVFTITPSTLTAAQATAGATVTVTYKPTAAGTQNGTITVSSNGATSQTVSVSGTATVTPKITVDPTSLSMNTNVGTPVTKTFTVTGANLSGTIYLTCSGTGFSIDKNSITRSQATAGATITVTYNPTAAGNHTGTVTLTSSGATTVTVDLNGTAVGAPTITADPTALSFNTVVGTPVTKTFTVTGANLSGTVYLSCSGTGFSIDKNSINRTQAQNGATVTVTYNPTATGNHTGTVTLTSNGATAVTVDLDGTAAGVPAITANPTSLSFNTVVGTPVTKTFTVTGANLTGTVYLSCSGTGFSIDKNSISRTQAQNGATVTVTYEPTAGGTHTGTVTLTSSGAQQVNVSLTGEAAGTPTVAADPAELNFQTIVGTPLTKAFTLSAANLEGNVTLAVQGDEFAIDKTNITPSAANNATINVTYTPTVFGTHTGTVTITSPNAPTITVALNGQADIVKYAPVMLPADQRFINLTKFRADWTYEALDENVSSYTLEVSPKPIVPEVELIGSVVGTDFTGSATGYYNITLPAPWGGLNVRGGLNKIIYFRSNYENDGSYGNITFTIPAGYENATFTMKITTSDTNDSRGNLTVATPQTPASTHYFNIGETYAWLVTASAGQKITITTPDDNYSPDIAKIEVYFGDATAANLLRAVETGDADYRMITGITNKYYTVKNLTAEGSFLYRVKALYIDGTESDWSNVEEVTLFDAGHDYEIGDVNHDGVLNIKDVSDLIDSLLGSEDVCEICSDINGDGLVNVGDAAGLIDLLLNGDNAASFNVSSPVNSMLLGR